MTQAVQKVEKAPVTIQGCLQSQKWKDELIKVLPNYLTPEMMLRIAMSAAKDQKFFNCSPESFFLALIKCARAGLVPDGRNAHLIPFGNEVQAIFDWKGLVAMAKRNGVEVTPKLVHQNDSFSVEEDDGTGNTRVRHAVDFQKARGEIILVYSRAKTIKSGEIDYEFMTADEVENVRHNFSRQKDSLMWQKAWGEAAKKTVIRRHSKRWDLSPEDRAAINSDDDTVDFNEPKPFAKPIFKTPETPKIEDAPNCESDVAGVGVQSETATSAAKSEPAAAAAPGFSPLKAVRGLCSSGSITEADLLGYLTHTGTTDGSHGSLDELSIAHPNVLKLVRDQWVNISSEIVSVKNGGPYAK